MQYKTYNCNSFNVYTIKTDKFKSAHMEVIFRSPADEKEITALNLLADIMTDTSKKHASRRDVVINLEELYKSIFYGVTAKIGSMEQINFIYDFINPKYINDENYLEDSLAFVFGMLLDANITNEEFDHKFFNIVKNRLKNDINSISEDPFRYSINRALKNMAPSPSSYMAYGSLEHLEELTPSSLYKVYKKMLKEMQCDIFVIGNLDMDEIVRLIKKYFKRRVINNQQLEVYLNNEARKKPLVINDKADFTQSNLVLIYNIDNLSDFEKDIVFYFYNYILCGGGLTSKLYQDIREKNSMCYGIDAMYLKFDGLYVIQVALEDQKVSKCLSLIKKNIKAMIEGKFSEEEINDARNTLEMNAVLTMDNEVAILNNYVFNVFAKSPLVDERLEQMRKVTKEDIVKVAKKVKLNMVYTLKGRESNERN